jgi:hypothetical protein
MSLLKRLLLIPRQLKYQRLNNRQLTQRLRMWRLNSLRLARKGLELNY